MGALNDQVVAELAALLGPKGLRRTADLAGQDPGMDGQNLEAGLAALPDSLTQLSALMAFCHAQEIPVVPQGGRTGLSGGAVSQAGQLIIMLDRFDDIEDFDPFGGTVTVGAGVTLARLQDFAEEKGLSAGIDLGARGSATIGGMVSTNAGGNEAFRNGVMRHRVLGLEVVLADGSVLDDRTQVTKVTDGYDIKHLFIGGEGTLGIVTRVVLQLLPKAEPTCSALCACPGAAEAVALFRRVMGRNDFELLGAEVMFATYARITAGLIGLDSLVATPDAQAFVLLDGRVRGTSGGEEEIFHEALGGAFEAGEVLDAVIAQSEGERADFWRLREDWSLETAYPNGLWYDVSVPLAHLQAYLDGLESRVKAIDASFIVSCFGHLGDGNMHFTISNGSPQSADTAKAVSHAVYQGLREMGGALSAEHGIGMSKRAGLAAYISPVKLAAMGAVKQALDPKNIMNPGKVVTL